MNSYTFAWGRLVSFVIPFVAAVAPALAAPPSVGPNVNMVSGTKWPEGDPFLTKQNEPSIAVSSRNSRHLLAGSNDYRLVPVEIAEALDDPEAWIQIYKSIDGGASWRATPLGGCPINIPECNDSTGLTAALRAKNPNFGADPTVRPGPYGTFFLSFIAGTRDTSANGVVAVQRFVDKNNDIQRATDVRGCTAGTPGCAPLYSPDNCTGPGAGCTLMGYVKVKSAEDPILPDVLNIIDVGTPGQGKDKPWVVADVGRRSWNGSKTCELLSWTKGRSDVTPAAETVGAFNVYVSYANFTGNGSKPAIFVAASSDCGKTFGKPVKISQAYKANQGTSSAVDPQSGALYVVWRNFDGPQQILMNKSTDGGLSWGWPVVVATFNPYDQGATGVSFRTLDFPSVAVSVDKNGVSRVHVAWSQRNVAPASTAPYACPDTNHPENCDARIVVATSKDGGQTFAAPKAVDGNVASPSNPANPNGRGHQVQASLTFAAGKLLATWLDQRQDHTEGVLQCPPGPACTNVSQLVEARRAAKNSNLDSNCHVDVSKPPLSTLPQAQKDQLDHCNRPDAVWTTFITDGTPGLVRRHTLDAYTAMADPADAPTFASSRVSQYTFGNTAQTTRNTYEIVQKEVNPPNLPMFSNGKSAFIGDYIDSAGQVIVATGDPAQPYKFNAGVSTNGAFVTGGLAPAFHVAFTDNRDVIPPLSGDWTTPTCLTTAFTKDVNGNITGVKTGATCGSGYAGNRNQNVYTAAIAENSVAFAGANSKLLDGTTARGFVVTVRNLGDTGRWYKLTLLAQPASGKASFDVTALSGTPVTTAAVFVQPRSASARTVWVKSTSANDKVTVQVASATQIVNPPSPPTYTPDGAFTTLVLLNPDANAPLVKNGDGTGALTDTAIDNVGNVVLSNAVLTNNALSNNALSNNVLSNNALTNAVLSNVVLSNAVLTNLDPVNAALSNNVLTNNALSNVVLSNAVLSNNALSNAVLSNVVLSNNALNAALTNLDPANVALSNAVLSNNALTNVVLSNLDPNNALSNAMLTNNALTNAVLSNVVLSNNALSNNALSNNSLQYVALSNAPLGDGANGGDPEALSTIETGAAEIAKNAFQTGDLANSNFKETTFTIRNRGNIDTTLAIKLMLRDAVCGPPLYPQYECHTPASYKLQLVLRKVALVPVAIPPTGPAVSTGRAIRIGFTQSNTEVSNVSDLPLIDPSDPNFGKFLPDDPNAAMLSLAAGEYAYATIRAIGVGGNTPPDPADLLQWGVKPVATNATNANGPLVIRTLNFTDTFVALTPATPTFRTFGGIAPIAGNAVCSDALGNTVLNGIGAPASNLGALGNFYIDTASQTLYGPKAAAGWPAGNPLIVNGGSGPQASKPCPPGAINFNPNPFTTDAGFNGTPTVTFTPKYWGDFYMLASVADASAPAQTDRQVIKVTVLPRPPVLTYAADFATNITFQLSRDLAPRVSSDSPVAITFTAGPVGTCHMDPDGHTLRIDHASPPNCSVTVHQNGNETYAPVTEIKSIFIDKASQDMVFTALPIDNQLTFGNAPTTLVAHTTSPTAPDSGLTVTYTSTTPLVCTVSGATVTIVGAGTCSLTADQAGDLNYKAAPQLTPSFVIKKADQIIAFAPPPPPVTFGDSPFTVSATSTSPTVPAGSGLPIFFNSTTPSTCIVSGTTSTSATITIKAAGLCTIAANQPGNGNFNDATPSPLTLNIPIARGMLVVTASVAPATMVYGDDVPPGAILPTTGASFTGPAACNVTAFATTQSGVPAAPANVVGSPYAISAALSSTLSPSCDVSYIGATLTVNKAPTQFTVAALEFTPLLSSATITGKLNRTDKPAVFPTNAASVVLKKGATTIGPFATTVPGGPDGAFTADAGFVASDTYTLTFDYLGSLNFLAATTSTPTLRVEGFSAADNVMFTPRLGHSSTLLPDGNVLVAGGVIDVAGTVTASAELYCTVASGPCAAVDVGKFRALPDMATPRYGHSATRLADGNVLIAGGVVDTFPHVTTSAEVYCAVVAGPLCLQSSDIGKFIPASPMFTARWGHTATLLGDNRVLVTGGYDDPMSPDATTTAELYCAAVGGPCGAADVFSVTGSTVLGRIAHTATLLGDGTVLVAGGDVSAVSTATAEIYCTAVTGPVCTLGSVGTFQPTLSAMSSPRYSHASAMLLDGRVLVAGGYDAGLAPLPTTASADVYCAVVVAGSCSVTDLGKFKSVGALVTGRTSHTFSVLTDGWVLAAGGVDATVPTLPAVLNSSELYHPAIDAFATGASFAGGARYGHAATRLLDGRVLVTGGRDFGSLLFDTAEIYNGPP